MPSVGDALAALLLLRVQVLSGTIEILIEALTVGCDFGLGDAQPQFHSCELLGQTANVRGYPVLKQWIISALTPKLNDTPLDGLDLQQHPGLLDASPTWTIRRRPKARR